MFPFLISEFYIASEFYIGRSLLSRISKPLEFSAIAQTDRVSLARARLEFVDSKNADPFLTSPNISIRPFIDRLDLVSRIRRRFRDFGEHSILFLLFFFSFFGISSRVHFPVSFGAAPLIRRTLSSWDPTPSEELINPRVLW